MLFHILDPGLEQERAPSHHGKVKRQGRNCDADRSGCESVRNLGEDDPPLRGDRAAAGGRAARQRLSGLWRCGPSQAPVHPPGARPRVFHRADPPAPEAVERPQQEQQGGEGAGAGACRRAAGEGPASAGDERGAVASRGSLRRRRQTRLPDHQGAGKRSLDGDRGGRKSWRARDDASGNRARPSTSEAAAREFLSGEQRRCCATT